MHAPPPPRPKYRYTGPALMLFFGLLGSIIGAAELHLVASNPEPVTIACEPDALAAVGTRRWIQVPDCVIDADNTVELSKNGHVESITIPLVVPDTSPPITVAVLETKKKEVLDGFVEMRRLEAIDDDAALEALAIQLVPALTGEGLRGVTTSMDREVDRFLPHLPSETLAIEHGRAPDPNLGYGGIGVGALLLALGGAFALRARKQTRADQAAYEAALAQGPAYAPYGSHGSPPRASHGSDGPQDPRFRQGPWL